MYIPIVSEIEFGKAQNDAKREKSLLVKKKEADIKKLGEKKTLDIIKSETIYKEKLEKIRIESKWKMDILYKTEKDPKKRQEKGKQIQESEKTKSKIVKSEFEKAKFIISSNCERDKNRIEITFQREVEYVRKKYQSKFGVARQIRI
ncbi:hypothetical protein M0R04_02900 [Candidatus Dojkabacteria bacterium]|jgi:hypothetical protein|nr:hypothetical protein [Candidatus Dojkabacteria bacterium]